MTLTGLYADDVRTFAVEEIPADAAMVMSSLDAGHAYQEERRNLGRMTYRTTTQLRLFRDLPAEPTCELYTRDVNRRGMGFITRNRLPLGYGGIVTLPDHKGEAAKIHCTVLRCREAARVGMKDAWGSIGNNRSLTFSRLRRKFE